jgi:hypothetical protein
MTPTLGDNWFLAIDKFRGLFESADRGTVFGGPGPVAADASEERTHG